MKVSKKILVTVFSLAVTCMSLSVFGATEKYSIIDNRGGKKVKAPKWLNKSMSVLEKDYPNKYAFIIRGRGQDLDFVENWAKRVSAGSEVAALLSQQLKDLTAASQYGGDANFQQTLETLTTSVSKATVVGLRREDDWWQLKQYKSGDRKGQREYEYSVLYLIDKNTIDKLVSNEMEKALTGMNSQTKERVKDAMNNLIIESGGEE